MTDRIVRPLGLSGTYAPGDDPHLPEPHAHTYQRFPGSVSWTDTTERNMTWADAAGALVTTHRDLDRFFTALLRGRLLPAEQLAEMRTTVPVGAEYEVAFPGWRNGTAYIVRDLDGRPVTPSQARAIIAERYELQPRARRRTTQP